jgi:NAD(P)-dependent dehydrogenase (short-subunit alcohol dehydrogenase family)
MNPLEGMRDRVVLVTGGTRGLGKAIGLEFARLGARVVLTHRWGSVPEEQVLEEFRREGSPLPWVVESDVSDAEATRDLIQGIAGRYGRLDVIVSNVAFAKVAGSLDELKRSALEISLRYSAWPTVDLVQASRRVLGRYPRYVIGVSSDGGQVCHPGYDLAGAAKATLEALCRYLAIRLRPEGVRVNAIRPGFMDTASSRAILGDAAVDAIAKGTSLAVDPRQVALSCVALCSGLMDAVTGQVIVVDEGWSLVGAAAYRVDSGLTEGFPRETSVEA